MNNGNNDDYASDQADVNTAHNDNNNNYASDRDDYSLLNYNNHIITALIESFILCIMARTMIMLMIAMFNAVCNDNNDNYPSDSDDKGLSQ